MMNNTVVSATTYTMHLTDGKGFDYYDVVDIHEIVIIGDTYNLVTDIGDMWIERDCCYRYCDDNGKLQYLEYRGSWFTAYFELLTRTN